MKHLYNNEFTKEQIIETKRGLRSSIFFLLLCVDTSTAKTYENVNVNQAFDNLLYKIGGLNKLLLCQKELVSVMSLLVAAQKVYNKDDFNFYRYRKLILDAGAEVAKLKEGE